MITIDQDGELSEGDPMLRAAVDDETCIGKRMTHFNVLGLARTRELAEWHNQLQELAATTRLGIPVTISTDPRHAFTDNPGAAHAPGPFSQWPEPIGLAAIARRGARRAVRRHRPPGVPGRRHPRRPAPADRPGHRAALGARRRAPSARTRS